MKNPFSNFSYNIILLYDKAYYYNLRYRFYRAKNIYDLTLIFKNISYTYSSADDILNILVECFTRYPLSDQELQKLSIWQQEYENTHNIYNYVSTVTWIAIIHTINNSYKSSP